MIASYSAGTIQTASPAATGSGTTISAPNGTRAWLVSVSTQAAYLTTDGTAPTSTNGLTLPAGSVNFFPINSSLTVLAASAGAVVNAIPLK